MKFRTFIVSPYYTKSCTRYLSTISLYSHPTGPSKDTREGIAVLVLFEAIVFLAAGGISFCAPGGEKTMKQIYRSSTDKRIAGVCGGIGHMLGVDPVIIRLLTVFLCFTPFVAAVVVTYLVAWALAPTRESMEAAHGLGI